MNYNQQYLRYLDQLPFDFEFVVVLQTPRAAISVASTLIHNPYHQSKLWCATRRLNIGRCGCVNKTDVKVNMKSLQEIFLAFAGCTVHVFLRSKCKC